MKTYWVPNDSIFDPEDPVDRAHPLFNFRDVEVVLKTDYDSLLAKSPTHG